MNLSKSDQCSLFENFSNENFAAFWSVNEKLLAYGENQLKHLPLRLLYRNEIHQELVTPFDKAGKEKTILDLLHQFTFTNVDIWIHGIRIPLEASLLWLSINMSFADNFLYLVLKDLE